MKKFFKFIHRPKQVAVVSIIIALIIGVFGYSAISKKPKDQLVKAESGVIKNVWTSGTSTQSSGQNLTLSFLASGRIQNVFVKTGDIVKNGDSLAVIDPGNTEGALTQAKAAYESAVANYNKLVNGATSNDITVSNTSVEISKTTLVHNKESLIISLNNSLTLSANAVNNNTNVLFDNPNTENPKLIRGSVVFNNQDLENKIINERVVLNGIFTSWKQELSVISVDSDLNKLSTNAIDHLKYIANYIDDLNTLFTLYSSAGDSNFQSIVVLDQNNILSARSVITAQVNSLTNATQLVSSSEKSLEQSQAILKQKVSAARPEDVAIAEAQIENARGAVQIAESAYQNHIIKAPNDGVITAVYITTGQIATPNSPAIDFSGQTFSKNVSIMIPNNSIINRNGKTYVLVESGDRKEEKEIIIGVSDSENTEVLSGISIGDEVVIH